MTKLTVYGYKVTLDETTGIITGDTFKCKDTLKKVFDCKYDSNTKSWIIDLADIKRFLNHISVSIDNTIESKPANKEAKSNGICPRCGTYCYGDCRA